MLSGGQISPVPAKRLVAGVPEGVHLARAKVTVSPGLREVLHAVRALPAEPALVDGDRLVLAVVDVHGRPGPGRDHVLGDEDLAALVVLDAGEGELLAAALLIVCGCLNISIE